MSALPLLLALLACGPRDAWQRHEPAPGGDDTASSQDTGQPPPPEDTSWEGPCPRDMLAVGSDLCVDACEAALQERQGDGWVDASPYDTVGGRQVRAVVACGSVPQAYISGDEADAACQAAGKRLCTSAEWLSACQGPQGWTWPYGDSHEDGACNDSYAGGHPLTDYYGTSDDWIWTTEAMNDPGINQQPGTVAAGGAFTACESWWGAFDLHGNLHEWVVDSSGTFRGGFYADASVNGSGCLYATTAHSRGYHDYSTGFRCCSDP